RDILVPTTGVRESCSLSGALPSSGSCAPRPEHHKYIAQAASVQALPALQPGALTHMPALRRVRSPIGRHSSTRKPLGHLPSPEDGPRTPTGQSLASENAPFGAVPRAAPHLLRSLITAGRSPLSHIRHKPRTPSIEQSAYQTPLPRKSLQNGDPGRFTYQKFGEFVASRSVF